MHYIIQGILFYFGIVILQIAIFTFVIGLIALGEYLYKKYQEMERERVQRQRMEYLRKNTEKSQYIEDTANIASMLKVVIMKMTRCTVMFLRILRE